MHNIPQKKCCAVGVKGLTMKKGFAGNRTRATCSQRTPKASIVPLDYEASLFNVNLIKHNKQ